MPKATYLGQFARERLPEIVPPEYRSLVLALTKPALQYAVLQFPHARNKVVTSSMVRRALGRLTGHDPILAVGANFTVEAAAMLGQRDAVIARLGDFHWTDESYHSVHQ